jgi:hypothetical protein
MSEEFASQIGICKHHACLSNTLLRRFPQHRAAEYKGRRAEFLGEISRLSSFRGCGEQGRKERRFVQAIQWLWDHSGCEQAKELLSELQFGL